MKKIVLFLIIILFVTGCNVTYEVSINNGKIKENLNILETNKALFNIQNEDGWTLREVYEALTYEDEFSKEDYQIKSLNSDDVLGVEYSSDSLNSVINSSILNQCYSNPSVTIKDDIVTIETGNDFECYEYYDNLENIEVRFTTNHEIVSTNSDLVDGDVYIWNISKNSNKNIKISYYESVTHNKYMPLIIGGVIVLIVVLGIAAYLIIKKRKDENRI